MGIFKEIKIVENKLFWTYFNLLQISTGLIGLFLKKKKS